MQQDDGNFAEGAGKVLQDLFAGQHHRDAGKTHRKVRVIRGGDAG